MFPGKNNDRLPKKNSNPVNEKIDFYLYCFTFFSFSQNSIAGDRCFVICCCIEVTNKNMEKRGFFSID